MALNFPNTPALEDTYAVGSVTWRWDGTTWQSSQQGGTNNVNATTFLALTDTPNTFETGKWLKEDSGALVWTDAPEFAVTQFNNVTSFPATDVNQAKFAYAIDSGALYYSDGSSWTNNRIVVTDDTTSSDLATLIGTMQKTYTFAVDDFTTGNAQENAVRKLVKLTDNLGNVQKWTLGVAGDGLSISKSTNPTGDDEILLTGQVQQYTPSIVASAPAADSILRLTGSGFDTGTQDLTFRGVDGLTVERVDDSTIQFRSPASTEYYDDDAKDAAFAALSGGTNTGINYTYDSTNKVINSNVTGGGGGGSSVEVPVFDQSESTSGGTYTTITNFAGGGHIVNYANTGANRHVDVKFGKLDNDKVYEFVLSYGSNGTDAYYGWYFADKQTTRSDNNDPTNYNAGSKRISDKINGANTATDHWKSYSRVSATDRYIEGDPVSGTSWDWPNNGMEWDPMQTGPYGNPQAEIAGWHFVIDVPRSKIWVKEYTETWENGDTGVWKGGGTPGDPVDPLTTPSVFLRRTGTGDYYFNIGMFIPSDGTGSCAVYAINEEHSAFRQGTIGGGGGSGATYDLTGTNSTTNQAIVQLVPSSGTTDTIEFVGSNGTTVAWDGANAKISIDSTAPVNADWTSTSGLSQISNKPSDTDLQANWTEVSNTTIGYIKNKPTLVESLGDLNNVDLSTAPNDQEVLKWVTANNQWEAKPDVSGAGGATTLSALSDTVIDAANLATKTKLQYDTATTKWINVEDTSNVIPSIEDIIATSASIDANGYGTLDFANGYKGYVLYKVETDVEAWVRIYCDSTSRTNDNVRSEGNDPLPGSGVIAEVRTTPSNNSVLVTPGVMGFNNENPRQPNIFVAINNRSTGASAVQVTLTVLKIGE